MLLLWQILTTNPNRNSDTKPNPKFYFSHFCTKNSLLLQTGNWKLNMQQMMQNFRDT